LFFNHAVSNKFNFFQHFRPLLWWECWLFFASLGPICAICKCENWSLMVLLYRCALIKCNWSHTWIYTACYYWITWHQTCSLSWTLWMLREEFIVVEKLFKLLYFLFSFFRFCRRCLKIMGQNFLPIKSILHNKIK
jgi:hypothetical protein